MKHIVIFLGLLPGFVHAQELFTYTEPASNMAAKSIGLRMNAMSFTGKNYDRAVVINPEIMFGISRKVMVHGNLFFSDYPGKSSQRNFGYNGGALYLKYRFFSQDEVHNHFRLAVFAEIATSNILIEQPALSMNGNNTGYEAGFVGTRLVNKIALSATAAFIRAYNNGDNKFGYGREARRAVEYTLSLGKLMLPKEYTDYNQTNLNLMLEVLGQYNPELSAGYVDLAPSIQLILQSRMRLDAGYRFPINDNLFRTNPRGFLVRFEYNIFNAYK